MKEKSRLEELLEYQILDTPPEKEIDDLTEIASAICGTPMSLITFIDDKRQWYKSKIGVSNSEVNIEDSFCQYTLDKPDELLIVEDATEHHLFKDHGAVKNSPYIRFYVGVPLLSPSGNIMGTLCVMDTEPMQISDVQKNALRLLARKTMDFLNIRKLIRFQKDAIEFNAEKLKKLTDQAPGVICQFELTQGESLQFDFISKGIEELYPSLKIEDLKQNPNSAFDLIHPDDLDNVKQSLNESYHNLKVWQTEYRVLNPKGKVSWHRVHATPERKSEETVVWYGTFQDISSRVEYESTMEQIAFDISHVLRRPVATLIGLTTLFKENELDAEKLKEYNKYIQIVSEELDEYVHKLNKTYSMKHQIIKGENHFKDDNL